jgi:uncharacterized protein YcfJ
MNRQGTFFLVMAFLMFALSGSAAMAGPGFRHHGKGEHFTDTAKVINVIPVYRTVRITEPVEECYEEVIYHEDYYDDDYRSATPMVAGGIIGGIVGNQFGSGDGKTFMTIAGTVLGGSIGRDIGASNRQHANNDDQIVTRCETIDHYREEEELEGYRVSYRYRGEMFHTTLPYHPGKKLKLSVSVQPYD